MCGELNGCWGYGVHVIQPPMFTPYPDVTQPSMRLEEWFAGKSVRAFSEIQLHLHAPLQTFVVIS